VSTRRGGLLDQSFYLFMSLLIAAIVVCGFSFTVGRNLFHPAVPRPLILYVHAAVFSAWPVLFVLQSALVRTRRVQWHRLLGRFGATLGVAIPVLGTSTAITMGRFNIAKLQSTHAESDLMIPLFDMLAFTTTLALAIYWRAKPEFHRRLMLVATCALTAAAFGRFPEWLLPSELFYAGVDALILVGVIRDLIVDRRIHRVYLYVVPAFIVGQSVVTYTVFNGLEYWKRIGHALLR
jgi:hypothetical protein